MRRLINTIYATLNHCGVTVVIRADDRNIRYAMTLSEAEDFLRGLEDAVIEARELKKDKP